MDQVKIGKYIASCRREKNYTQSQLAEELGLTDKAVSKWENGKSMPDISIFLPLCELLGISLNELLLGEHISTNVLKEKSNQVLMDVITNWFGREQHTATRIYNKDDALLSVRNVSKIYKEDTTPTNAVKDVSR